MDKGEKGSSLLDESDLEELSGKLPEHLCNILMYQNGRFDSLVIIEDTNTPGRFVGILMIREYGVKVVNTPSLTKEEVEELRGVLADMIIEEEELFKVVFEGKDLKKIIYDDEDGGVNFVSFGLNMGGQEQGRGSFYLPRDVFLAYKGKYSVSPYNIEFLTTEEDQRRHIYNRSLVSGEDKKVNERSRLKSKPKTKPKPKPEPKPEPEPEPNLFSINDGRRRKPPSIINQTDTVNLQIRGVPVEVIEEIRLKLNEVAELLRENGGVPEGMTPVEFGKRWRELFRKALDLSSSKCYVPLEKGD